MKEQNPLFPQHGTTEILPEPGNFRVAVLVLNYNGLRWLKTCIPSLLDSVSRGFGLFILDNGSDDDSVDYIRLHFPKVGVVRFESNLGFAKAYNEAIQQVFADYVVLLNNDTLVLSHDWIDRLLEVVERDRCVGAVQCKMVSLDEQDRLDSVGGMGIKYWQGYSDIGKFEIDKKQYDSPPISPFSVCAGAALVKRSAYLDVGGFDQTFFMYLDDVDLSWRLRLAGYSIRYQPLAKIAHAWHGSWGPARDAFLTYLSRRNILRMLLKNCGKDTLWWALRNYLIHSSLMFTAYLAMRDRKTFAVIKALLWNIINFKDTYSKRVAIQSRRKVSEPEILRAMFPDFEFHPLRHEKLRRILNTFLAGGGSEESARLW